MTTTRINTNGAGEAVRLTDEGYPGVAVTEASLVAGLCDQVYIRTGLLPPVVKWFSASRRLWLFERPAGIAEISYHHAKPYAIADGTYKQHQVSLPIPWTLYTVEIDETYFPITVSCFVTSGPVTSENQAIGVLPLPNHYPSGRLCVPANVRAEVQPTNVAEALALAYQMAWHSGFNTDLMEGVASAYKYRQPTPLFEGVKSRVSLLAMYARWEKATVAEVCGWNWPDPKGQYASVGRDHRVYARTVGQLLQYLVHDDMVRAGAPSALSIAVGGALARADQIPQTTPVEPAEPVGLRRIDPVGVAQIQGLRYSIAPAQTAPTVSWIDVTTSIQNPTGNVWVEVPTNPPAAVTWPDIAPPDQPPVDDEPEP